MKDRSLLKFVSVAIIALFFSANAQALTLYVNHNTGVDVQTVNNLSYGYMMDDIIDLPGLSFSFTEVSPGNFSMTISLDSSYAKGNYSLGFLSSDGILDDEELILVIQ